jgi:hypothetical protein
MSIQVVTNYLNQVLDTSRLAIGTLELTDSSTQDPTLKQ